jgi:hypothetical protein
MLARSLSSLALAVLAAAATTALAADPQLKPFVLAQKAAGEPAALATEVRGKLAAAGFQEAGSCEPYPGAIVIAVTGGEVKALHAKFRIAVNFPDLSMMGSHSFMGIRCAPDAIEDAFKRVAGVKK